MKGSRRDPLRRYLVTLLDWGDAHVTFDAAVKGIPAKLRGVKAKGLPYSLWQLVEHIRLAQKDILDFCRNPNYRSGTWPDDYWPKKPAPPNSRSWQRSLAAFRRDRRAVERLAANLRLNLHAKIPHGDGQTYLREILLVADHNAFHVGEIVVVGPHLGAWK
jgi:hypothetical protein